MTMTERLYARLGEDVNIRLRRGAWYRVLLIEGMDAILEVNKRPRKVLKALLEIVRHPPPRWTVVTQESSMAKRTAASLTERYGVCPSCGERAPLPRRVRQLRCAQCKWEFEIAWNEAYLG